MQEKVADRVGGSPPVFDAPAPHSHSSGPIIAASEASAQSPADKHCEHMTRRMVGDESNCHGVRIDRFPSYVSFWPALKCLSVSNARDQAPARPASLPPASQARSLKDNPLSATPPGQVRCFSTLQHCDCLTQEGVVADICKTTHTNTRPVRTILTSALSLPSCHGATSCYVVRVISGEQSRT